MFHIAENLAYLGEGIDLSVGYDAAYAGGGDDGAADADADADDTSGP